MRNTIIVMTSNLGSSYLNDLPENSTKVPPETRELVQGAIRAALPPEFINRIDSIVIFNRLAQREIRKIVEVRLAEIQQRMAKNGRDVTLKLSDAAVDWLAATGYNPVYGARPLNRAIQHEMLDPLARYLIDGSIRDGEEAHIELDARANRLVVKPNHESTMELDVEDAFGEPDSDDGDEIEVEEMD